MHTHTHTYIYIYIYIWRDRERERYSQLRPSSDIRRVSPDDRSLKSQCCN